MEQRTILRNIMVQLGRNIIIIILTSTKIGSKWVPTPYYTLPAAYHLVNYSFLDWIFRALRRVWFVENHFDYLDELS